MSDEHVTTETVTREVVTDASSQPQEIAETVTEVIAAQSDATVEQIEASADAQVAVIDAQAAADVQRIEAQKEESEWRSMITSRVEAMDQTLSSIQAQLAQTPPLTVQVQSGTPTNTPQGLEADPSIEQTEVSAPAVAAVVAVEQTPAPARRAPVRQRRERYL